MQRRRADNLTIISRQQQGAGIRFPDLATSTGAGNGQDVILRAAGDAEAELVILDNLATLSELSDENEAAVSSDIRNPSRDDTENPSTSVTVMPRLAPVRVSP